MSDLFNASICEAVAVGHCVILEGEEDQHIVYAGPINASPTPAAGRLVLLNPEDFNKLKTVVDRGRH